MSTLKCDQKPGEDAEVLIDAICQITGTTETYSSMIPEPFTFLPETQRAIALPDGSITSPFLEMFGRPARDTGLTDERNNRMRVFTPIVEEEAASATQMSRMLRANFHSALDAKYSVYEGFVVSVFTHPLRELTESQLLDAMRQVAKLAETYGTTYSSTGLIFGGEEEEEQEEESKQLEKRS